MPLWMPDSGITDRVKWHNGCSSMPLSAIHYYLKLDPKCHFRKVIHRPWPENPIFPGVHFRQKIPKQSPKTARNGTKRAKCAAKTGEILAHTTVICAEFRPFFLYFGWSPGNKKSLHTSTQIPYHLPRNDQPRRRRNEGNACRRTGDHHGLLRAIDHLEPPHTRLA